MKTILAIHLLNNYSGSPRVFASAIDALQERGHQVTLLTSKGPGFLDGKANRQIHIPYRWHANRWMRLLLFMISQVYLFFRLLAWWPKEVTFYINTLLPFGAAMAAKLMGKRVVYYCHETHIDPPILNRWLRFWVKAAADDLIIVSEYLRKELKFEGKPYRVLPNVLPAELLADSELPHAPRKDFGILMAASLKKGKGLWEFIQLAEAMPDFPFTLVIGADQAEIDAFLGDTKFPENLTLMARQHDMRPLYRKASLLLNLSVPGLFHETFGMTILEGMAYGLPVIVPPVGAPVDIVTEGHDGFLIDSRKTDKLKACIELLATDKPRYQSLVASARQTAKSYDQDRFSKGIVQVFAS